MPVHHIVLFKFVQDVTLADVENVKARLASLPSRVPDLVSDIKVGRKIKHSLDRDFDEAVILVLKSESALEAYRSHPEHQKLREFTDPYIQDKLTLDIHFEE